MQKSRILFALLGSLALSAALAACGGDDGLSDEEYFRRMDEIDKDLDAQFETVCEGEDVTARQCATDFANAAGNAEDLYNDVSPPDDVQDEHEQLVTAIGGFRDSMENAAGEFQEDDPIDAFFESEAFNSVTPVEDAFCAIQAIADQKNIAADVGCDAGGEEQPDPSTIEPVEATEVLIQDFVFDPPHIQVNVGDTVTWTQGADPEAHTATADDGFFDTGILSEEGDTGEFTFEEAGEYPYFCEIHPEMLGQVTVVP